MATALESKTIRLNSSKVVENILQVSIDSITRVVRDTLGNAAANAFAAGVGSNPFTPTVRIRYKVTGNCDDFPGIEIEKGESRMLFPDRYNLMAFGVGGTVTYFVDVDELSYGEEACSIGEEEEQGRRRVRKFALDLYAEVNLTPGFGGAVLVEEFTQLVKVEECCPAADDNEGGGWT